MMLVIQYFYLGLILDLFGSVDMIYDSASNISTDYIINDKS